MRTKDLKGTEIILVDINEEGLKKIEKLAHILNEKFDSKMKISSTTDRKKALPGADFVIISVTIDREDTWKKDMEIALKYGISHYAENGGPGAFAHTARNLNIIIPILEDIKVLCPEAVILNFTNPMQRICTAIREVTDNRFIGICHQLNAGYVILAKAFEDELGIDIEKNSWTEGEFKDRVEYHFGIVSASQARFDIKAAGINHFTWAMDIRDRTTGEDVYSKALDRILSLPPDYEPLTQKMTRIFGCIPVVGDSHLSEYMPYTSSKADNTYNEFNIHTYDI